MESCRVKERPFGWIHLVLTLLSFLLHVEAGAPDSQLRLRASDCAPEPIFTSWRLWKSLEKVQGATRSGATGLRASERKSASERVSERTSENLSKISEIFAAQEHTLTQCFLEAFLKGSSERGSRGSKKGFL